jgi:K+-sensing histidine kinase KdpD
LLTSIIHDFRTPLASILGAATGLIEYGTRLTEAARRDLLAQIKDEAEHLDGMVRNLLAITRVEAGALEVNRDWVDVRELLHRAVAKANRVEAAKLLGLESVPTLRLSHLNPAQRRAYVIADNKLAQNAGWDRAKLEEARQQVRPGEVPYLGPDKLQ